MYHPGPPLPVGFLILADVGKHGLLQAFVMKSDYPQYQLRLESGATKSTSIHEAWLAPRILGMAPDQDDLFAKIREQVERGPLRMGSYGVHGDAQWESLCLVDEAKAFTKAIKSGNAGVTTHLWNNQIMTAGMPKEHRNGSLTGFRKLGFKLFRQSLVKDCCAFMAWAHGKNWMKRRQCNGSGALTDLRQDQRTISSKC
jgi:hypothetical protein